MAIYFTGTEIFYNFGQVRKIQSQVHPILPVESDQLRDIVSAKNIEAYIIGIKLIN